MKKLLFAISLVSSLALAEGVQPSPVDQKGRDNDIQGAIVPATPEQKATIKPPVKAKKAKKKKNSKKAAK